MFSEKSHQKYGQERAGEMFALNCTNLKRQQIDVRRMGGRQRRRSDTAPSHDATMEEEPKAEGQRMERGATYSQCFDALGFNT